MNEEKKVPTTRKTSKNAESENTFQVSGKGYSETFDKKEDALKQAEILKKRAIKNQESVDVTVKEIEKNGKGKQIHKVKISEDFYD